MNPLTIMLGVLVYTDFYPYLRNMKNNPNFQYPLTRLEELGFKPYFEDGYLISKIDWPVNQSDSVYHEVNEILFLLNSYPKKIIKFL